MTEQYIHTQSTEEVEDQQERDPEGSLPEEVIEDDFDPEEEIEDDDDEDWGEDEEYEEPDWDDSGRAPDVNPYGEPD